MYQAIEKETITVGALGVRFLIESDDSNGTASVFECYVPANSRMPAPHSHDGFEETIYGLEGITTWTIDGETVEVGPGEAVCVKRGQIHGFQNHGSVDAKILCIATPARVRARLLPRDRRGPRRQRRRPPRPGRRLRSDAPPRPHPRPAQRRLTTTSCVSRSSPTTHRATQARWRGAVAGGAPGPANQSRSHHPSPDAEEGTSCHFKS